MADAKPRALYLIPTDYDSLLQKGVAQVLNDRDENGFLERVITVHPFATQERVLDITPSHRLYEFKERFLPFCSRFKLLRAPHHLAHTVRVLRRMAEIIDDEHLNFIRAFDPVFTGLLAWLLTRLRRKPLCISIHADYDKRFELDAAEGGATVMGSRRLARFLEHFTLSRADLVMPIRETLAQKEIRNGISASKIRVIPHGIDLTPFRKVPSVNIRQLYGIAAQIRILSFAGRLSKENYIYDILELAVRLKKTRSDFAILMAGDGTERSAFESRVRDSGLQDTVKVLGSVSRETVYALRQSSDISLCLMGGYSLIEACAAGHPVVAYDVEWHSELVKTKITGWLVPEGDIAALTEAVSYLMEHPEESRRMGEAAKTLAFERHDIQKTNALKCSYYLELLQSRTART